MEIEQYPRVGMTPLGLYYVFESPEHEERVNRRCLVGVAVFCVGMLISMLMLLVAVFRYL